ncbi:hypothetical protein HT031_001188 [Scenedesmus sp. PABB004]|nr:hypothetical protein HT031_001188 [Scenedesmus sp. PABB004]
MWFRSAVTAESALYGGGGSGACGAAAGGVRRQATKQPAGRGDKRRGRSRSTSPTRVAPAPASPPPAAAGAAAGAARSGLGGAAAPAPPPAEPAPAEPESRAAARQRRGRRRGRRPGGERDPLLHWSECWGGPGLRRRAAPAPGPPLARVAGAGQLEPPGSPGTPPCSPRAAGGSGGGLGSPRAVAGGSGGLGSPRAAGISGGLGSPRAGSSGCATAKPPPQRGAPPPPARGVPALRVAGPGAAGARPARRRAPLRLWVCGGVTVAALSGGAVVAAYSVLAYFLKAGIAFSLAWKAATGVAAAEGLAVGGWGLSTVRRERAAAAAATADLARVRAQAARELAALRGLLQQKEAEHGQELAGVTAMNDRLGRLAASLRSENAGLQGALDRAAAERKALEAEAALEASRAGAAAAAAAAEAQGRRVLAEVAGLARSQAQLVSVVCELREDLLGLVAAEAQPPGASRAASSSAKHLVSFSLDDLAASGAFAASFDDDAGLAAAAAAPAGGGFAAAAAAPPPGCDGSASSADSLTLGAAGSAALAESCGELAVLSSSSSGKLPRMTSVRGTVDAALAATIADTLQL